MFEKMSGQKIFAPPIRKSSGNSYVTDYIEVKRKLVSSYEMLLNQLRGLKLEKGLNHTGTLHKTLFKYEFRKKLKD